MAAIAPKISPWTRLHVGSQLFILAAAIVTPVTFLATLLWNAAPFGQSSLRTWAVVLGVTSVGATLLMLRTVTRGALGRVARLSDAIWTLSNGDLATEHKFPESDAVARIGRDVDAMAAKWSTTVANVRNSASVVAQTGGKLADASDELARRTSQQAAALEETAANIQHLTETVSENAEKAAKVDELAGSLHASVAGSEKTVDLAVQTIHGIQAMSSRMSDIVTTIDGIAFQTNILALNAAVEAARAGEQGRSFAVVAAEVSTLAKRAAVAAREIKILIGESSDQIGTGVAHVHAVADSLHTILSGVQQVANQVAQISAATAEQSRGLGQIARSIEELDAITQHNNDLVEHSAGAAAELSERAARIAKWVNKYRLRQGCADEAIAMVHRALKHAETHGVQSTIAAVNDPKQRYSDRDMYVFIVDSNSNFLACAGRPERVGKNMSNAPGTDVRRIQMLTKARADAGGGWIEYDNSNPVTGALEPKMSYVKRLGPDFYIGCGVYRNESMAA